MNIHLGYEVGTGKAVAIPLRHTAVTGITQLSGKTTTLEAMISRSGLRALAFRTKREEGGFHNAVEIPPYFRQRTDWQFVRSILEATLRQGMKFQTSWIMKLCEAYNARDEQWPEPKTLQDVRNNASTALLKARGINESIYRELGGYLDIVLPQINRLPYSNKVALNPGLNVVNLEKYSTEMNALVIRSMIEWIYKHERGVITIIPEAWKFVPQKRGSPVKDVAQSLLREGAVIKNFIWFDSQDIAGVEKEMLRQVGVWILGVQGEIHETKRALEHLPGENPKPTVKDVMKLRLGQFFVRYDDVLLKVYVQPAWLTNQQAQLAAQTGIIPPEPRSSGKNSQEDAVWKERYEAENQARRGLERDVEKLTADVKRLTGDLEQLRRKPHVDSSFEKPTTPATPAQNPKAAGKFQGKAALALTSASESPIPQHLTPSTEPNGFYESFRARLLRDPQVLQVLAQRPEIEVKIERPTIQIDGTSLKGRVALLISQGFLDSGRSNVEIFREARRQFNIANPSAPRLNEAVSDLHTMGFLVRDDNGGYLAVPEMKVRITES